MLRSLKSIRFLAFALILVLATALVSAQGVNFTLVSSASLPWEAVPSPDGTTIY